MIWSNYSDLTRPHLKWWFSKGKPLISGKSRLVKYYNLARNDVFFCFFPERVGETIKMNFGLSPLPVTVANEGLGWDPLLKMQ